VCVLYAGIPVDDFYTGNEAEALLSTGAFEEVNVALPGGLKRGDILVTPVKGHTVVALTNGDGTVTKPSMPESPAFGRYTIGWHEDNNGWWYADTENTYLTNTWELINHHWYYFGDNGYMLVGWQNIEGKTYYLQESADEGYQGALWKSDGSGAQSRWYV
jgi:hypothetical protein